MSDMDDEARRALRLTRINQKGLEVATRLAHLKAGQNITLADMWVPGLDMEAITKEARVRAFLDMINASRARLGTDAYGACLACGSGLEPLALDETPWLERCVGCAADKAPLG